MSSFFALCIGTFVLVSLTHFTSLLVHCVTLLRRGGKILEKELPVSVMQQLMSLLKEERVVLERQLGLFKSCQLTKMMQYAAELSTRRLAEIHVLLSEYASESETESHTGTFEDQNPERLVEFQEV